MYVLDLNNEDFKEFYKLSVSNYQYYQEELDRLAPQYDDNFIEWQFTLGMHYHAGWLVALLDDAVDRKNSNVEDN